MPTVPGEAFGENWLQRQHGSPSTYTPTWLQHDLVSCMKVFGRTLAETAALGASRPDWAGFAHRSGCQMTMLNAVVCIFHMRRVADGPSMQTTLAEGP